MKLMMMMMMTMIVGKSSLTVQFVENHFVESYYPTIENTFSSTIKYKNQDFLTEIVDTAGQVGTSFMHSGRIKDSNGFVPKIL